MASVKPYSLSAAALAESAWTGSVTGLSAETASQPENDDGRSDASALGAAFASDLAAFAAGLGGCAMLVGICAASEAIGTKTARVTPKVAAASESRAGMQCMGILLTFSLYRASDGCHMCTRLNRHSLSRI